MENIEASCSISLDQAKNYIYSLDFSRLTEKLINHGGWLRDDVEETCVQYRNYFFLLKKYASSDYQSLPPSEDIDEFWHQHILDTNAYVKDCELIFGKFLHHYPYLGIDGKTDFQYLNNAFQQTQALYYREFGVYMTPTKSRYPKVLYFFMKKLSK